MVLTTDDALIRSILEDESVIGGYEGIENVMDLHKNAIYLHSEGIGIFPAIIDGDNADIHAAIPKANRGLRALKAGKLAVYILMWLGYTVTAKVRYNDKATRSFINMVGFTYVDSDAEFKNYRYM